MVDVRSPCEFIKEYIPGSVNVPLLSDDERAEVGTVYRKEGEFRARKLALSIVAPKIPTIVNSILSEKRENHTLVVNCWRGGMRSEAVVSFLSLMGVDCWRLTGGYKAWRKQVLNDFDSDQYPFEVVVLDGLTGVGKTEVLLELSKLGASVLDLEGVASHRGSIFGGLGLPGQPSQKNFDGFLWDELRRVPGGVLFVEAESKSIGSIRLPEFLMERIKKGTRILLKGSLGARVARIEREYDLATYGEEINGLLQKIQIFKERLGREKLSNLSDALRSGNYSLAVQSLLTDYYDPLYRRHLSPESDYALSVSSDDVTSCAEKIQEWSMGLNVGVRAEAVDKA